ncbi:MAG: preprotein translocase subunit SecG [Alphaproteobacteria bacterium]|nr:MAG: preprotein translocase subunit SecG [Alphaproteobacteria bacterium]
MFTFLLVIHTIIAAAMVAVILMQRSEGGGLGVGGSPSGLMSARGAADFLTRATSILAGLFIVLSIILAGLATMRAGPTRIDPNLSRTAPGAPVGGGPLGAAPAAPAPADPLAGAAEQAGRSAASAAPSVEAAPTANGTATSNLAR